jgi:hypothetical protein
MYHVYLRKYDGRIIGEVSHPSTAAAAQQAFAALVNRTDYDGFEVAAVLTENKRPIAIHRFDQKDGDPQFWRDRSHQIPFSPLH